MGVGGLHRLAHIDQPHLPHTHTHTHTPQKIEEHTKSFSSSSSSSFRSCSFSTSSYLSFVPQNIVLAEVGVHQITLLVHLLHELQTHTHTT